MPGASSPFPSKYNSPQNFDHRAHLELAFYALSCWPFLEACTKVSDHLKQLATDAGHPEKFNLTLTLGFLSLIAERLAIYPYKEFESFLETNRDLITEALEPWYSRERLASTSSRHIFLLPDRYPQGSIKG